MTDAAPEIDPQLLAGLLLGAEKSFANAEQLFSEAQILAEAGAVARALCLHQISLEECSKVDSLGAWATSLVLGCAVDQKRVLRALSHHAAKNKLNAYMLEVSDAELSARERGDWEAASALFKEAQEQLHAASNQAKNASLYVDWTEGGFVAPSERITVEMLAEITERNAAFLGYACNNVRTLRRLVAAPDDMRALMASFVEGIEKVRAEQPKDLVAATDSLLARFLEDGLAQAERQR